MMIKTAIYHLQQRYQRTQMHMPMVILVHHLLFVILSALLFIYFINMPNYIAFKVKLKCSDMFVSFVICALDFFNFIKVKSN